MRNNTEDTPLLSSPASKAALLDKATQQQRVRAAVWYRAPRAQLLLCLFLAIAIRLVVLLRSQGMMEGDESILGIQAERILRGEHPLYFYGQSYMGSWDAYLAAPLVALFGPSGWVLHVVTLSESLALVPLLGALAARLYGERARLPGMLLAALPPLFVLIGQTRMLGGYIETMVLGAALMLLVVLIADRWAARRPAWVPWLLLGLVSGLAFWIDILILSTFLVCVIWLAPLAVARARHAWQEGLAWWRGVALSAICCLVAFSVGASPALLYGLQHQFSNVQLVFEIGQSGGLGPRLDVLVYALGTVLLRLVGSSTDWFPPGLDHQVAKLLGIIPSAITLLAMGYTTLLILRHHPFRRRGQTTTAGSAPLQWWKYTLAPALVLAVFLVYWRSPVAGVWLYLKTTDRYLLPAASGLSLMLALFFADLPVILAWLAKRIPGQCLPQPGWHGARASSLLVGGLLVLVLLAYVVPYGMYDGIRALSSPYASGDLLFPAKHGEVVTYLEQQHIQAAWTNHWIGNVLMYLEDGKIACADYLEVNWAAALDTVRIPEAWPLVQNADRPSFIFEALPEGGEPAIAQAIDQLGVHYTLVHFGPIWVLTPQTRTVRPEEIVSALKKDYWPVKEAGWFA